MNIKSTEKDALNIIPYEIVFKIVGSSTIQKRHVRDLNVSNASYWEYFRQELTVKDVVSFARTNKIFYQYLIDDFKGLWDRDAALGKSEMDDETDDRKIAADITPEVSDFLKFIDGCRQLSCLNLLVKENKSFYKVDFKTWFNKDRGPSGLKEPFSFLHDHKFSHITRRTMQTEDFIYPLSHNKNEEVRMSTIASASYFLKKDWCASKYQGQRLANLARWFSQLSPYGLIDFPREILLSCILSPVHQLSIVDITSLALTSKALYQELVENYRGLWDRTAKFSSLELENNSMLPFMQYIDGFRRFNLDRKINKTIESGCVVKHGNGWYVKFFDRQCNLDDIRPRFVEEWRLNSRLHSSFKILNKKLNELGKLKLREISIAESERKAALFKKALTILGLLILLFACCFSPLIFNSIRIGFRTGWDL